MRSVGLSESAQLTLLLRVPLFTMVTAGLGVVAHVAAGGSAPDGVTLAAVLIVVALLSTLMARVEQSLLRLLGGVLWVQVSIHLALSQGTTSGMSAADCQDTALAAASGALSTAGAPVAAVPAGHAMHNSLWMWLAHAAAGVAVAFWLRRGEAACWRAARRVIARLLPATPALPIPYRTTTTWVDEPGDARLGPPPVLLGHRWRGPPRPAARLLVPFTRPAFSS